MCIISNDAPVIVTVWCVSELSVIVGRSFLAATEVRILSVSEGCSPARTPDMVLSGLPVKVLLESVRKAYAGKVTSKSRC